MAPEQWFTGPSTGVQVPRDDAVSQREQASVQLPLQHTPSTHHPDAQSPGRAQLAPATWGVYVSTSRLESSPVK